MRPSRRRRRQIGGATLCALATAIGLAMPATASPARHDASPARSQAAAAPHDRAPTDERHNQVRARTGTVRTTVRDDVASVRRAPEIPSRARRVLTGATWATSTAGTLLVVLHTVSLVVPASAG